MRARRSRRSAPGRAVWAADQRRRPGAGIGQARARRGSSGPPAPRSPMQSNSAANRSPAASRVQRSRAATISAPAAASGGSNAQASSGRPLPQRAVPLGQRRPVRGQRPEIAAIGQRQQPVEILPAERRGSRGELHVAREEDDREPASDRIGQPLRTRRRRAGSASGDRRAGIPPRGCRPALPRRRPPHGSRSRRSPPLPDRPLRETSGTGPGSRPPRGSWSCPARWRRAARRRRDGIAQSRSARFLNPRATRRRSRTTGS